VGANERDGIVLKEPTTTAEREAAAAACTKGLGLTIPCLVDGMDDAVGKAWAGWPDRLYVVATDGTIAYKGEPGPRGLRPREAEEALRRALGVPADAPAASDADDDRGVERFQARIPDLLKAAGADRDGALNREAFVALVPALRQAWLELAPRNARPSRRDELLSNESMLLKYDKDGDRRLSPEERKAMEEDERQETLRLFGTVDADGNGTVTGAELRAALGTILGEGYDRAKQHKQ
jgi:hypothetical protein